MPRFPILAALAAACALPAPLAGQTTNAAARIDYTAERAAIAQFQDRDQRLQDVGWQLARANAAFCPRVVPGIGLQLQDMASYGVPAIARTALGLTGDFAVQTAARGSPAALTGAFARNREIIRLEGFNPNDWRAGRAMDWQRLARAHDHVDAMLTEHGGIAVTFADGETARVQPVDVCASRFELMGEGDRAVADGTRVVIGIGFPAFAYQEEPVFAALVAHELAHNVLGHDAWLDRVGRKPKFVRRIEREADRLVPWLLANAGYDPQAGAAFMIRWGSRHDSGLKLRTRHDGWDERAEAMAAEEPIIRALMARDGRADWAQHFRREIDPAGGLARTARR
ncbi:hypothetical protein [Porphyrobacter sp. TH134]|uniref:hypothetical protein n=1 Tax=Porphyrobacter sp. TH134 TaxID=2067450 RepID=UPI001F28660B|nr:hypothetical protein [Porphyrobacter sp. TH134]